MGLILLCAFSVYKLGVLMQYFITNISPVTRCACNKAIANPIHGRQTKGCMPQRLFWYVELLETRKHPGKHGTGGNLTAATALLVEVEVCRTCVKFML